LRLTALRETCEESGLTDKALEIDYGFEKTLRYESAGKPKEVIYWLARLVDSTAPIVLSDEHQVCV